MQKYVYIMCIDVYACVYTYYVYLHYVYIYVYIHLNVKLLCWNFNSVPWLLLSKTGLKFGFTAVYFSITYMTTMTAQCKVILAILG